MLVTADNLTGLVSATALCDTKLVDTFSLNIALGTEVFRMKSDVKAPIIYGQPYDKDVYFEGSSTLDRDLTLAPGDRVLACSADNYTMPCSYFGLVQTKGSLARLFVAVTCNDGQVEPGYSGRITLEMMNHATCPISIPVGAIVAQLFVFRCTTQSKPYAGRYQGATGPTLATFNR